MQRLMDYCWLIIGEGWKQISLEAFAL